MKKTFLKKIRTGMGALSALMLLAAATFTGCSDGSSGGSTDKSEPTVETLPEDEGVITDVDGTAVQTVTPESDENADIQIVMCGD